MKWPVLRICRGEETKPAMGRSVPKASKRAIWEPEIVPEFVSQFNIYLCIIAGFLHSMNDLSPCNGVALHYISAALC